VIRQIVCALDILRPSRAAIRHAFEIAERFNALLDVVYAQPNFSSSLVGVRSQREASSTSHERLRKVVATVVTPIQGRASLHVLPEQPVAAILEHAARTKSDLIVLGSFPDDIPDEQRSRVADRISRDAHCAVMTSNEWTWADPPGISRILLPVGAGALGPRVVEWAATLAWHFDAQIELFHVLAPATSDEAGVQASKAASERLARCKEVLNGRGATVSRATLGEGPTAPRIVERAESTGADLILMTTPESQDGSAVAATDIVAAVRRDTGTRVLSVKTERD
jgi:nucleotide-binding universal stress UspA family protein